MIVQYLKLPKVQYIDIILNDKTYRYIGQLHQDYKY